MVEPNDRKTMATGKGREDMDAEMIPNQQRDGNPPYQQRKTMVTPGKGKREQLLEDLEDNIQRRNSQGREDEEDKEDLTES